jgi:hypothetical protein
VSLPSTPTPTPPPLPQPFGCLSSLRSAIEATAVPMLVEALIDAESPLDTLQLREWRRKPADLVVHPHSPTAADADGPDQ